MPGDKKLYSHWSGNDRDEVNPRRQGWARGGPFTRPSSRLYRRPLRFPHYKLPRLDIIFSGFGANVDGEISPKWRTLPLKIFENQICEPSYRQSSPSDASLLARR